MKDTKKDDFNLLEYNLFWVLHFLIIFLIISLLGVNFNFCLEKFMELLDFQNWF